MREIIFRGKRINNGEWVFSGNLITFNDEGEGKMFFIPELNAKCSCTHDDQDNILSFESGVFYKVDPSTVGQFTGLTDKNGVRIFEGDIVIFNRGRNLPNTCPRPLKIFFDERNSQFTCYASPYATLQKDMMQECEVIGNTHDNPELLEDA